MSIYQQECQYGASQKVTKVYKDPVLQHSGKGRLFFQQRNDQKAVSRKELASCKQNQRQSCGEEECSYKLSKISSDCSCGNLKSNRPETDKHACQNAEHKHLHRRQLRLLFSDSHIILCNFRWCIHLSIPPICSRCAAALNGKAASAHMNSSVIFQLVKTITLFPGKCHHTLCRKILKKKPGSRLLFFFTLHEYG